MIDEKYRRIALIGMGKNVGKTTVLNYLIKSFAAQNKSLALTSIGRDGEDVDVVTKTTKPRIFAPSGSIVATAEGLLSLCDISLEVLNVTDYYTPMGRVCIVRALTQGFVQLGGPSIAAQMASLLDGLPFDIDKILIDGAISRKSLAAPHIADAAILCTGAAISSDINEVIAQTRFIANIYLLPQAMPKDGDIVLQGAVTDNIIQPLLNTPDLKNKRVVAEDAGKIFISRPMYEKLQIRRVGLAVLKPIVLAAITVNPTSPRGYSFAAQEFLERMREAVPIPVYDVKRM